MMPDITKHPLDVFSLSKTPFPATFVMSIPLSPHCNLFGEEPQIAFMEMAGSTPG
jgi:hypothetical protein